MQENIEKKILKKRKVKLLKLDDAEENDEPEKEEVQHRYRNYNRGEEARGFRGLMICLNIRLLLRNVLRSLTKKFRDEENKDSPQ